MRFGDHLYTWKNPLGGGLELEPFTESLGIPQTIFRVTENIGGKMKSRISEYSLDLPVYLAYIQYIWPSGSRDQGGYYYMSNKKSHNMDKYILGIEY